MLTDKIDQSWNLNEFFKGLAYGVLRQSQKRLSGLVRGFDDQQVVDDNNAIGNDLGEEL